MNPWTSYCTGICVSANGFGQLKWNFWKPGSCCSVPKMELQVFVAILSQPLSAMWHIHRAQGKICCHSWAVIVSPLSTMLCFYDVLCPCWFVIIPSFKFSPCPPSWVLNTNISTAHISVAGLVSGQISFYTLHSVLFGYPSAFGWLYDAMGLWVYIKKHRWIAAVGHFSQQLFKCLEYAVFDPQHVSLYTSNVPTCITCTYTYTPNPN